MNKDQVKGEAKDIAGKIQEEAGKLTGSTEQQVKGLKKQAEGKIQKGVGDLKEAVTDLKETAKKGQEFQPRKLPRLGMLGNNIFCPFYIDSPLICINIYSSFSYYATALLQALWIWWSLYQLKKENPMKNIKLFIVTMMLAGMTGCLSFGSGKTGPQGPQGEPGDKETIIIVPERQ